MRESSDAQAAEANRRLLKTPEGSRRARVSPSEWPTGERWCAGCQSFVPTFYCSGSRCKACTSMASHARRLEDNYGIDAREYARILAKQGGRCAICRNTPRTIRFAVDHDHKTGAVRGILCKRCNHDLLGGGHDSIEVLFAALAYLLYPPAQDPGFKPTTDHVLTELRQRLLDRQSLADALAQAQATEAQEPPF
jgi:hypothetical protein